MARSGPGGGETAAITQPVAVSGLGGVGKSTLAREYAWQAQDGYSGVWWLNAASDKDAATWEGLEEGLIALSEHYIPGLSREPDRALAARKALRLLQNGAFAKPWLLVFDNVDDPKVLDVWRPQGNVKTLVTSRVTRIARGVVEVEIKEWVMLDAVRYLVAESVRSDLTEDDARAIADALGRLPLALSHAATYLKDNATATPKSYLAAINRHMREAPADVQYDRAVYATFMEQVAAAEARAQRARHVLSLAAFYAPDEVPEELFTQTPQNYPDVLAAVIADPARRERAIGVLDKLSLIDFAPDSRTFLVQGAARDALGSDNEAWAQRAVVVACSAFPEPTQGTRSACARLVSPVRALQAHVTPATGTREFGCLLETAASYMQERAALADCSIGNSIHSRAAEHYLSRLRGRTHMPQIQITRAGSYRRASAELPFPSIRESKTAAAPWPIDRTAPHSYAEAT